MIDSCGREIDHLRLSLTDHCNLACRYCTPGGAPPGGHAISSELAFQLVSWLAQRHGIRHVRLTGGEPLLYPELMPLVSRLSRLDALHEITLTTNGQALEQQSAALHRAGLSRVNVSLDTLDPQRFAFVTCGGRLERTLAGIRTAVASGLTPVRINVVVQRGLNDGELAEIAAWGLSRGCTVRFLEVMPIGPLRHVAEQHLVPADEVLERLGRRFTLEPIPQSLGQPAVDYVASGEGLRGVIGIIAPTTRPFCSRCRRLRVTCRGQLVACLHDHTRFDLMRCWDGQSLDVAAADVLLHRAVSGKPAAGSPSQSLTMLALGG